MRRGTVLFVLLWLTLGGSPRAAESTGNQPAVSPAPKKTEKKVEEKDGQSPLSKLMGDGKAPGSNEPATTEIFADEAFFDSGKSIGIFTGHVKVTDPRFNVQSDKLTVYLSKGENQGLEKAVAEGNVGVVRDRPDANGGPPTHAVGRSDIATYISATGDVELRGSPRVQQGESTHIATTPETVMVINQNGQLTTHGPSRTDIRQQEPPKGEGGAAGPAIGGATPAKADGKTKTKQGTPTPSPKSR